MRFTVLKTKLMVSPLFFAVLTAFLIMDKSGIAGEAVFFSALHELGHFLALFCAKTYAKEIKISVFGIHMSLPEYLSTQKKCFVLMAGFAVNFVLAVLLFCFGKTIDGYINLFIGIFTAMPIGATDGGTILKILIENTALQKAQKTAGTISFLFSAVVSILFSAAAFYTHNFYLLFAVLYIMIMAIK